LAVCKINSAKCGFRLNPATIPAGKRPVYNERIVAGYLSTSILSFLFNKQDAKASDYLSLTDLRLEGLRPSLSEIVVILFFKQIRRATNNKQQTSLDRIFFHLPKPWSVGLSRRRISSHRRAGWGRGGGGPTSPILPLTPNT